MKKYLLTGIEQATGSADRNRFDIEFQTDQGPVTLTVNAAHLDVLITTLQGLEYQASLLNPAKGALPGEVGQVRAEIVDHHQVGNGEVSGKPSVFIGMKSGQVFRIFALDAARAEALQREIADAIPKLRSSEDRQ
jgi:hypothetical protein